MLADLVRGFAWFTIIYFLVLNSGYLGLIVLAAVAAIGAQRDAPFAGRDELFASPLTPPVTIIVPAHDEAERIVECVNGLLGLRYPEFQVIVVDDGSTDDTFARLHSTFDLVEIPLVVRHDVPVRGRICSSHVARNGTDLVVIRKESIGRPADPVNAGINAARHPLVCRVDADCVLDEEALLAVAAPFVEDPERIVVVGATVRVANGSAIEHGRVRTVRLPRTWLVRFQSIEYLRAFMLGRVGWAQLGGVLFVSGAFGLFRRDAVVEVGGMDTDSEGDDVELVLRLHHQFRRTGRRYGVGFVADPCCWTRAPSRYGDLARQRRRWAQILTEALWIHRSMILHPRYGFIGMVVMPYFVVFELCGAVVELLAFPVFAVGMAIGIVDPRVALLAVIIGFGFATFLSVAAIAVEEFSYHRAARWRDLGLAVVTAFAENLGYRQIYAWWRIRGVVHAFGGQPASWVDPSGGQDRAPAPAPAATPGPSTA